MDVPDRLLHVGPYKTGTTTVQRAFDENRDRLAAHDICFLGSPLQPHEAVHALLAADAGPPSERQAPAWQQLVKEVDASPKRVAVLSSELLCTAGEWARTRLAEDFLGERGRVVVTLRSLALIMPSQWQQSVQAGLRGGLDHYVRRQLNAWPTQDTGFWRRHRHDLLVQRWAGIVGADRVTVVVADEEDPGFLLRRFAAILGIPEDALAAATESANRSLTWEELQAIRAFNRAFDARTREHAKAGRTLREPARWRAQAWAWFKEHDPDPGHHPVRLPAWARDEMVRHAEEVVAGIRASGVALEGPVEQLVAPPPVSTGQLPDTADPALVGQVAARIAETLIRKVNRAKAAGGKRRHEPR